jgi:hypothetical protein
MIDPITEYILEQQDGNILTEDLYKLASFFKDVPLVGNYARQYTVGHDISQVGTIAAGALVAVMAALAYKVYKNHFTMAAKSCKAYKGQTKQSCMKKFKEDSIKLQIQAYQKMLSKCKFSKEAEKCHNLAKNKIDKLKAKIGKYSQESEDLKILASYYVELQNDISRSDKNNLFNFIQNATDFQIENLLTNKNIIENSNLLEFSQNDVTPEQMIKIMQLKVALEKIKKFGTTKVDVSEDSFKVWLGLIKKFGQDLKSTLKPGKIMQAGMKSGAEKGVLVLGGTLLAALILTVSFKVYKRYLSKAARFCSKKEGTDKSACMIKFKREAMQKRILMLRAGKDSCKFSKDPAKCNFKIDKKINKIKLQLGNLHL